MNELTIRRNRGPAAPKYQSAGKTEKTSSSSRSQKAERGTGAAASGAQLMSRAGQTEGQTRESRKILQTGEAVLDEVRDVLDRIKELAGKSAGDGNPDRAALQKELERLRGEIDRMISSAASGGPQLFLDEGLEDGMRAALSSLLSGGAPAQDGLQALPDWLAAALGKDAPTADRLLSELGLDQTASAAEILAAATNSPLEGGSAAGYLAALYLGAVIAGKGSPEHVSQEEALAGLRQLLEQVAGGLTPDQAVEQLTDGKFTTLAGFQEAFTQGTAPGLQQFLTNLLLTEEAPGPALSGSPLLVLLAEMKGMNLELLMGLLTTPQLPENGQGHAQPEIMPQMNQEAESGATAAEKTADAAPPEPSTFRGTALQFGGIRATGQDLSGVSYNSSTGVLTVGGKADVVLQGAGAGTIALTGSGTVTLQNVEGAVLAVDAPEGRVLTVGRNALEEVVLKKGASLTLGGSGVLEAGAVRAGRSNTLRLTGGAVIVQEKEREEGKALTLRAIIEGPASLAAQAVNVSSGGGKPLTPFDVVWKTLLPGWKGISAMEVDGRMGRTALQGGERPDAVRLWLAKPDPSHGYPAHTLAFQSRDEVGRLRTRYTYLIWNRRTGQFEEMSMYPNPFIVTGGEQGQDWIYEEETRTLRILTGAVTAISGGMGLDANQSPFSGRVALADGIGALELALGGVVCRVSAGKAFDLGCENNVTLVLRSGTRSHLESGAGCAGISLGEGTTLCIDCAVPEDGAAPDGILTATGGGGSSGIGWDSSANQARLGHILIRGGAGTGAGKGGFAASVTIVGGTVAAGGQENSTGSGVCLQVGEDAVTLPQFRLSSRALQLDRLSVATREQARAAGLTIDAGRRWVSQIQAAYGELYEQLEHSFSALYHVHQYIDVTKGQIRDGTAASSLLEDARRSILLQSAQAMRSHGKRGTEDVGQLLQ